MAALTSALNARCAQRTLAAARAANNDVSILFEKHVVSYRVGDGELRVLPGSEEYDSAKSIADPAARSQIAQAAWLNSHLAMARARGGALQVDGGLQISSGEAAEALAVVWQLLGRAMGAPPPTEPGSIFPSDARPLSERHRLLPRSQMGTSGLASERKGRTCENPGCREPGEKACAGCKAAFYCSASCQRESWKGHKCLCTHVSAGKGERPGREEVLAIPCWKKSTHPDEKAEHLDLFEARHEKPRRSPSSRVSPQCARDPDSSWPT
mmetsp:Transcript_25904/g.65754  ORF Transcript_25904/g.65754 Transcript_25904/m.65754 type:complete len:268 (-) Transcript_25904:364-1167(-)